MGLIVDTNVFVVQERRGSAIDLSPWGGSEDLYISVVTASELLTGVHRADTEIRRQRRSAFVEAIISEIDVLDFTIAVARLHAKLSTQGNIIGAHDLIIAATALHYNFALLTDNVSEFRRVDGLSIVEFASPR